MAQNSLGPFGWFLAAAVVGVRAGSDQANIPISLRNGFEMGPILALNVHFEG